MTVVRALDVAGSLVGKTMLVTGGAGGVGQFAIQLGSLAGANVTAVSSRREYWPHLQGLGAAEVVATIETRRDPSIWFWSPLVVDRWLPRSNVSRQAVWS